MSKLEVMRTQVSDYLRKKLSSSILGGYLHTASIALTVVEQEVVWDILLVLDDETFDAFQVKYGSSFVVDDHEHLPPVFTKVKSLSWLQRDLASRPAIALWLYRNALVLNDPEDRFVTSVDLAWQNFQNSIPHLMRIKYLELRTERHNLRHIVGRDIAFEIVKGNIAKLALELFLLVRGEPYPYKKRLPNVVKEHSEAGQCLYGVCESFLREGSLEKTIQISDALVASIRDMLAESGMFTDDFLDSWWLHLQ